MPLFHHTNVRKNPSRQLAGRALLAIAYLLFFSVQTCFRYTAGPTDMEAMQANLVKAQAAGMQGQHATFRQNVKSGAFSYLNKRYEQSSMLYLPVHPGQISPVSFLVAHQYIYQNDNRVSSIHNPAFLRGPPSLQS